MPADFFRTARQEYEPAPLVFAALLAGAPYAATRPLEPVAFGFHHCTRAVSGLRGLAL